MASRPVAELSIIHDAHELRKLGWLDYRMAYFFIAPQVHVYFGTVRSWHTTTTL